MGSVGPYTLLRRIAQGGMAEVFLARRDGPDGFAKIVALKRILPHLASLPDFVAMFHDEARLAARLTHPNIVQIYDFGRFDDAHFLAMEYVAGEDLLAVMQRARELAVPFPPVLVATILAAACEGLHHAHLLADDSGAPLGLVHRDVSPSNLLVSYDGVVKLADFGVAKAGAGADDTAAGALKGKYAYMSPEQALGGRVDHRSDIFSLGVVGHELLTGRRLFRRDGELAVLKAVADSPVPPPRHLRPDLPASLEGIVMRALERAPDRRWPTAQAMQLALEEYLVAEATAGARIRLAGFLLRLFGDEAAATRRRWAHGDVGDGEPTASTSGSLDGAVPPARSAAELRRSSAPDGQRLARGRRSSIPDGPSSIPGRRSSAPGASAPLLETPAASSLAASPPSGRQTAPTLAGSKSGHGRWFLAGAMTPLALLGAVELALRLRHRPT